MCDLKSIIKLLSVNFKVLFSCFTVQLLLWFDWKSLEDPGTDPRVGSDLTFSRMQIRFDTSGPANLDLFLSFQSKQNKHGETSRVSPSR